MQWLLEYSRDTRLYGFKLLTMRLDGYYFPEGVFVLLIIYLVVLILIICNTKDAKELEITIPISYVALMLITLAFSAMIHKSHSEFVKEQRNVIIEDKIVPVKDTLIVIGKDTLQIEEFYKFKEYKD